MLKIVSPTGKGIRDHDALGYGKFKAPRGDRLHQGVDFICEHGQIIVSPIDGKIVREARPYLGEHYSGLLITDGVVQVKMFYFKPYRKDTMRPVYQGSPIGIAQDISARKPNYKGMTLHVHLEIKINPAILQPDLLKSVQPGIYIDPEILL